jgi:hypothetical protein
MSDIRFQLLTTKQDLTNYQEQTAQQVDVELPMAYLQKARVLGLKADGSDVIYGGFTMAFEGPLRCLSQLPETVRECNPTLRRFHDQCFEINGLWLNHKLAPDNSRLQLYLACIREASRLTVKGKSKYVYAYCADNEKLRRFYQNFNSKEIYEGPVAPLPGMKKVGRERVEMGCMKRLPLTILRNPLFLMRRAQWKTAAPLVDSLKKIGRVKESWL